MHSSPFKFTVGEGAWADEIRYYTRELNPDYWASFQPLSRRDIDAIERSVGRPLPEDLREFLRIFGCGAFPEPYGGIIYSPDDFAVACHGHLWMVLGSDSWASDDEQRRFYVSRGTFNPNPKKYTQEALSFGDLNLLDLLQFGTNGLACYHQIFVGERPGRIGYCLLTPERTMENEAPSFSEGLKLILAHHWNWKEAPDELPPEGRFRFEPE